MIKHLGNKARRLGLSAVSVLLLLCIAASPFVAATITGGTLIASYPTTHEVGSFNLTSTPISFKLPNGSKYKTTNIAAWISDVPIYYVWCSLYMVSPTGQDISSEYYIDTFSGLGKLPGATSEIVCNLGSREPTPRKSGQIYLDNCYSKIPPASMKSGYGVFGRVNLDTSTYNMKKDYYERELVSANVTATYAINNYGTWSIDGLSKSDKTVTMEETAAKSGVYVLPQNSASHYNYRKVYIPVAWPDNSNYTITYNIDVVYKDRTKQISRCCEVIAAGTCGQGSNSFLVYDKSFWNAWETKTQSYSITKTIYVNGNMYQDDFSGDRL